MSVSEPDFTMDELVEALRAEADAEGEGFRVVELADALNWNVHRVRERLAVLKGAGQVVPCRKRMTTLDGRTTNVPAYRLRRGDG